jgi:hypothetical protein
MDPLTRAWEEDLAHQPKTNPTTPNQHQPTHSYHYLQSHHKVINLNVIGYAAQRSPVSARLHMLHYIALSTHPLFSLHIYINNINQGSGSRGNQDARWVSSIRWGYECQSTTHWMITLPKPQHTTHQHRSTGLINQPNMSPKRQPNNKPIHQWMMNDDETKAKGRRGSKDKVATRWCSSRGLGGRRIQYMCWSTWSIVQWLDNPNQDQGYN